MYGRDPCLPTETALSPPVSRGYVNLKEYGAELTTKLSGAWELARQCVGKAQSKQKKAYDKPSGFPNFVVGELVGERVFLFKPAENTGEARKLARPYNGYYRIMELDANTVHIHRVDCPQDETILVALSHLRRCADEIPDECWPPSPK